MHKLLVEFLGTFALMAVILYSNGNWFLIGLMLGIDVLLGGKISGGCFNPAVTLGSCMANNLSYSEFLPYVIVELLGAALAAMIYAKTKKRK
jgi:aquaporin Z